MSKIKVYISQLHWALDIKYKFDQHNDTSFQYLWPIGSPEPLTGKSEKSGFGRNCYTECPKIRYINVINYFRTLRIWTFALALIKTQIQHLFESFSTKKPCNIIENCSPSIYYKITIKMCIYLVKKVKRMAILYFGQCPSQWS